MSFPKFHGITLALNAFIENLTAERLSADPSPLSAGRLWYNTTAKALKFSSLDAGGAVIVETIATGAQVQDALDQLAALGVRVSDIESSYVKLDGSVAFEGNIDAGTNKVVNVAAGTQSGDAVNYGQLQSAISSLANAFKYIGTVNGGATTGEAYNLSGVAAQAAGSYYKVTQSGYFVLGSEGTPFYANANDGIVFNDADGVDVIDNTNSTVVGTNGFITVTGSPDTGYHVTIDDVFKARVSTLESGLSAEISRATAAEGELASDIAAETSRATTAEGVLDGKITTEKNRAESAEANLSNQIGSANDAIAAEVTRATAAEASLRSDLTSEVNRAQSAETALGGRIDGVVSDLAAEVTRATGVEGTLASLTTDVKTNLVAAINEVDARADAAAAAVATEASRAQAAEAQLSSDIAAEASRAAGVEGSLAALTTDVKTNLVAAINEVDAHADANASAIAAETSRATAAEADLAGDISDEVTRATAAEGAINTKIGDLTSLTTDSKTSIVSAINEVAAAAGEGTGALKSAINAQRYRSTAATAALSHTFTHNLNSAYIQVQVWVKDDAGIFRNDIVAVEETNSNTVTVSLTESRIVKVAIQALDDLA